MVPILVADAMANSKLLRAHGTRRKVSRDSFDHIWRSTSVVLGALGALGCV